MEKALVALSPFKEWMVTYIPQAQKVNVDALVKLGTSSNARANNSKKVIELSNVSHNEMNHVGLACMELEESVH